MKAKDIITPITSLVLFCLVHYSAPAPIDPDDLTSEQKNCLFDCLTCVEVWGYQYDGESCANACVQTNGASIDGECKFGVNVGKRYKIIQAKDTCKKQCGVCSAKYSKGIYDEANCTSKCEETEGVDIDTACTNHVGVYDVIMKYHYQK